MLSLNTIDYFIEQIQTSQLEILNVINQMINQLEDYKKYYCKDEIYMAEMSIRPEELIIESNDYYKLIDQRLGINKSIIESEKYLNTTIESIKMRFEQFFLSCKHDKNLLEKLH